MVYEGKEPFIFVSYPHKNSGEVLPLVEEICQRGILAWYDIGIEAGTEWPEYIARRLDDCAAVLLFLSPYTQASPNCRREIVYAGSAGKKIIAVSLAPSQFSPDVEGYLKGVLILNKRDFKDGFALADALCGYKEISACRSSTYRHVGRIFMGKTEQEYGQICPIEWRVLKREGRRALVISNYVLACRQFSRDYGNATWDNCSLREWLNGSFYNNTFTRGEREQILLTKVRTPANAVTGTHGGGETQDRLFVLSKEEAETYFKDDDDRLARATACAIGRGVDVFDGFSRWWLRSPGLEEGNVIAVDTDGTTEPLNLFTIGDGDDPTDNSVSAYDYGVGVRPAMWVELKI